MVARQRRAVLPIVVLSCYVAALFLSLLLPPPWEQYVYISSYNVFCGWCQPTTHLTNHGIPGILETGPERAALGLLVAPTQVTS